VALDRVQLELLAAHPGVHVHQTEDQKNAHESETVDQEERHAVRMGHVANVTRDELEHELQRIDVEQHEKQKDRVQRDGDLVRHRIAAEERVVHVPDPGQHREADRERDEPAHLGHQLRERLRHFEGDDDERQREAEHDVAEGLDARHFSSANTERQLFLHGCNSSGGCADCHVTNVSLATVKAAAWPPHSI